MKICPVCVAQSWERRPLPLRALSRSDCRPLQGDKCLLRCQRCGMLGSDQEWSPEFYADYDPQEQLAKGEQLLFCEPLATPQPRSRLILHHLQQRQLLPAQGRSLDIGCNHGFFSAELRALLPAWQVYGYEPLPRSSVLRDQNLPAGHFLHGPLSELHCPADLISLIHVLEHLPEPRQFLTELRSLLRPGGRLLIQVPDYSQTPYDLVIVDHLWHWQTETLRQLLQQTGFEIILLESLIAKELTALCQLASAPWPQPVYVPVDSQPLNEALKQLALLKTRVQQFEASRPEREGPRVVMGTAVAAACLTGLLSRPVQAYWDEAPGPPGRRFAGRPVWSRSDLPASGILFLPFPAWQAEKIRLRLQSDLPGWEFV